MPVEMLANKQKNIVYISMFTFFILAVSFTVDPSNVLGALLCSFFAIVCSCKLDKFTKLIFVWHSIFCCIVTIFQCYLLYKNGTLSVLSQSDTTFTTDSQFYYGITKQLINNFDYKLLFSTWGSFVVIIYGYVVMNLFGMSYIGFLLANSLLYALSIRYIVLVYNLKLTKAQCFVLSILPTTLYYDSMLSKESISLFLFTMLLYLLTSKKGIVSKFLLIGLCLVPISIFRPALFLIAIVAAIFINKKFSFLKYLQRLAIYCLLSVVAIYVVRAFEIPLPIIGADRHFSIFGASNINIQNAIESKGLPGYLYELLTPPVSFILSPILSFLWMVSPLPILTNLTDAISNLLAGGNIIDISIIFRYLSSAINLTMIMIIIIYRQYLKFRIDLFLTLMTIIIPTVSVQFLESGRHRYLPEVFLVLLAFSIKNDYVFSRIQKTINNTKH